MPWRLIEVDEDDATDADLTDSELIGASVEAVRIAEDRQRFKDKMLEIGLQVPVSGTAKTLDEALSIVDYLVEIWSSDAVSLRYPVDPGVFEVIKLVRE
jgi:hypothetical protein